MSICSNISNDILKSCDSDRAVHGIEQRIVLINTSDLPYSGITMDSVNPSALITKIQLSSGKKGYEVQGVNRIMSYTNSFEASEDSLGGVKHSIAGIRIYDPSEEIRKEVNNFINGAKVYAVIERVWKGKENKYAFLFFGLKFGLELSEIADSSNENDGTIVLTLSTPAGYKEPFLPHIYRDTDYATSLTTFNNKFAS